DFPRIHVVSRDPVIRGLDQGKALDIGATAPGSRSTRSATASGSSGTGSCATAGAASPRSCSLFVFAGFCGLTQNGRRVLGAWHREVRGNVRQRKYGCVRVDVETVGFR